MDISIVPTPSPLAENFESLGIAAITYAHPPVFTVEEGRDFKHRIPGGHTKNLFLKDKKEQLWLITALWDTAIDLKALPDQIGCDRVSFGSAERMDRAIGVTPGSVTPFALINDTQRTVRPILDMRLMAYDIVNCHPLKNDKTTGITPKDLLRFIEALGYDPLVVDFGLI